MELLCLVLYPNLIDKKNASELAQFVADRL